MRALFLILITLATQIVVLGQSKLLFHSNLTDSQWVDSVFNTMTLEQKIGQTIMIRSFSDKEASYYKDIEATVRKYNVGGVCFFKGKAVSQVEATNMYQSAAKIPLFIGIDGEHGVAMRLTDVVAFPYMMTLAATDNPELMKRMGELVGKQCNRLGITANFIPSVDVNNNKDNPVINYRSFGDNRERVVNMATAYIEGQQSQGVLATAKHFPGHGDTNTDSHESVPVIKHTRQRLDSIELYPFQKVIDAGVWGVMVAHLNVPTLDPKSGSISSRSKPIVTDVLKNQLGFQGLVFTDGLEMKGFAQGKPSGEAEVEALIAGNDILLLPMDTEKTFNAILEAVRSGRLPESEIDAKCKKILHYKYLTGLANLSTVSTQNLLTDLNTNEVKQLIQEIFNSAITIVANDDDILPLSTTDNYKIASISIGGKPDNAFVKTMKTYAQIDSYTLPSDPTSEEMAAMETKLKKYNLIIADIQNTSIFSSKKYGINDKIYPFLTKLASDNSVILNVFANPYSLMRFKDLNVFKAVVCSYQDRQETHEASAKIIFGKLQPKGTLPVSIGIPSVSNQDVKKKSRNTLEYVTPESMGVDLIKMTTIDNIIQKAIDDRIFPGCQVFAAKDGKVFLNKSYGSFAYDDNAVQNDDIYDLASLTKILATTAAIMKLYDEGKISLNEKISTYLPNFDLGNKANLKVGDILLHQAGLAPDIANIQGKVSYIDTRDTIATLDAMSCKIRVADSIYTDKNNCPLFMELINQSKLTLPATYKYSDLGFILLKYAIENITGEPFDTYLQTTFYTPLGLSTMTFNPLQKGIAQSHIIPTVEETTFRKQRLCGYVHDPKAALLGGIAGHAGLFANAEDVGVFMQMLLQKGKYDSITYFDPQTVHKFTKAAKEKSTHRGYGFNKPYTASTVDRNPAAPCCSPSTFGHTGFTGTSAWADPKTGIVFVFLSNRTYPNYDKGNNLGKERIRERVQELLYEAVK